MTFLHVAIMVAVLLAAMVASMLYYGSRGKKKMRELFDQAAERLGGTVTQKNRMHYPHLAAEVEGRPVEVFFHLSEGHRKTADIVYLVLATPVKLPASTVVVQEGFFSAAEGKGSFNEVAGDFLAGLMDGRYVYSEDEAHATTLFADGTVVERLKPLGRYANIVLGPDAVTCGKPYGGPKDLAADRLEGDLKCLVALAHQLSETNAAKPLETATPA